VETCEAIMNGQSRAFISLGGNFLRAVPDTTAMEDGWRRLRLSVQIATKLNRSHVVHGEIAYLLPCLGRIELDEQATGPQAVSMESSIAHFHGSRGKGKPASPELLSEPAIVAGIARRRSAKPRCHGTAGSRTMPRSAMRSSEPIRRRSRISTNGCLRRAVCQAAAGARTQVGDEERQGKFPDAGKTLSGIFDGASALTSFILRRCDPTTSSTRRSTGTATAFAGWRARARLSS
jgi:anaerobic selenocysteine-containing dehydrogenase